MSLLDRKDRITIIGEIGLKPSWLTTNVRQTERNLFYSFLPVDYLFISEYIFI
jgi:Tat protein secretion system quality control protein TatD with DNase activity